MFGFPAYDGKLPREKQNVIVVFAPIEKLGLPETFVVGYLRYSAGDKSCPYFVTPGFKRDGRKIIGWIARLDDLNGAWLDRMNNVVEVSDGQV